jgi:hypothetical protein
MPKNKKHIIYIPGRNPKPEAHQYRQLIWRIMLEGVKRCDQNTADELQKNHPNFHLVSWNGLYYHEKKEIEKDMPLVEALINKHGPTKEDILDAHSSKRKMSHLLLTVADHIPLIIPMLPKDVQNATNDIARYFNNTNQIGDEVRALFKNTLRPLLKQKEEILLIGHSLGSVIAYDALWELSQKEKIEGKVDFLTIGSPLSMHYIKKRLLGMKNPQNITYPKLIDKWTNFTAEGDIAAINQRFDRSFYPMIKQGIVNSIENKDKGIYNFYHNNIGLSCHHAYGYLINPVVGHYIKNWHQKNKNELRTQ